MPTPTQAIADAIRESGLPLANQRAIILYLHGLGRWHPKTLDICIDRAIALARSGNSRPRLPGSNYPTSNP